MSVRAVSALRLASLSVVEAAECQLAVDAVDSVVEGSSRCELFDFSDSWSIVGRGRMLIGELVVLSSGMT